MMSEKILACPYCGKPTVLAVYNPQGKDSFVECSGCKTQGPSGKNEAEAIAKWNAAANALEQKDAEIARLVEACDDLEGEYLRMKEHSENLMLRINQLEEYKETWYKRAKESLEQRDEARKVARRYYQESERKDGDITRLREEIDKVNALRPIGEPPIIAYYTPHGQPVSVTNNPVSYTRTEPQTIRVAETSESDGN